MANGGLIQISQAIDERFAEIDSVRKGNFAGAIPSGFSDLDKILQGGIRPSDLIIVAGRPSMGKSALQLAIALNVASDGRSVGFFSLEMSTRGLVSRLLSMKSHVAGESIRTGYVTEEELNKLQEAGKFLSGLPFYIDDSGGLSVKDIGNRLAAQPVELVFVDYVQLIHDSAGISETERVTRISRELKELSKSTKLPFVVAAQLNREVEKRRDKKPMLSDLRQSGQLEQDADTVVGLYRPEVYEPDNPDWTGYAEAIVVKNRDGGLGTSRMSFAGKYSLFTNYVSVATDPIPTDTTSYNGNWSDVGD